MVHKLYNEDTVFERHRHRYEFNNLYRDKFIESDMVFSGLTPDGQIIETLELNEHPFFVGCLFHPEFKSRPNRYHPLFKGFVEEALIFSKKRVKCNSRVL